MVDGDFFGFKVVGAHVRNPSSFSEKLKMSASNCEDFKSRICLSVRQNLYPYKAAGNVNHV